ncbi:MFS transporter [Actinoplanes sp. NPDC049668]|uniref:MFS transporter n=1 Tax=unclassified Actinoplanes TaxID=2626549 RepID=UPI0033A8E4E1
MTQSAVDDQRDVIAYGGRPPVRVRRGTAAPFGWWPAIVVALVALIDRIEYNLLAGALPRIQAEFGFSDAAAGAIPTAGALAAVVLLLPAGRLADTGKRTWIIASVVAVWALLTVGTGLTGTYAVLFGVRVLLGAAGQLYNPPAASLLGDLYPGSSRARAYGLERAAYFSGLPIGVIAGGALADAFGWRTGFFLVAVPGVLIAMLVLTIREPVRGLGDRLSRWYADPAVSPNPVTPVDVTATAVEAHRAARAPAAPAGSMWAQLRALLRIRTLRLVVIGLSILFFGLGGTFFWMPSFYERAFFPGDEAASAALAGGSGLVGIVAGIALGSWLGDRWHGRRPGWRVALGGWSLLVGTAALAVAVSVPVLAVNATFFTLANVGFAGAIANLTAANADVVAAQRRGLGFAVLQFVVTLGGAFGPWLVGVASTALNDGGATPGDSLRYAFWVVVAPLLAGSLVVLAGRTSYDRDAARALSAA